MSYSSCLTDEEWAIIEPLLPKKRRTRPPKWPKRQILDGIFYQLKNGCSWGDLPKDGCVANILNCHKLPG
jgi:transposase